MANYTIELRDVVKYCPIFDFDYPFYDEAKRKQFEETFIRHFYFREIGAETIDRFKLYLQDKMNTVFPYYNELFKSASIDYDVLDNYKLTETYTRNVDTNDKHRGVSSTVGRLYDEQESEANQNKSVDSIGNVDTTTQDITDSRENSVTDSTSTTTTEKNETVDNDTTSNGSIKNTGSRELERNVNETGNKTTDNEEIKKFLDTPQGAVNLSDTKYLTTLNHDTLDGKESTTNKQTTNENESSNSTQTTTGSGTSDTTTTGNSQSNTTEHSETNTTNHSQSDGKSNTDTTGNETTKDNIKTTSKQESKTTADNDTRTFSEGERKETYTLTRRGNIGVDTDSDAIEKHNRLQKTLKNIERMFFDECEDLFMLVY